MEFKSAVSVSCPFFVLKRWLLGGRISYNSTAEAHSNTILSRFAWLSTRLGEPKRHVVEFAEFIAGMRNKKVTKSPSWFLTILRTKMMGPRRQAGKLRKEESYGYVEWRHVAS